MLRGSRCGEHKPVDEFAWRRKRRGQRDSHCRPCRSAYGKEHYAANRQRYIDQAQLVKQRVRLERTVLLLTFFRTHPCLDCGETDPVVLEFDHIGEKRFNIGEALLSRTWQAVVEEIEQCEVVCANCHRRRTARRRRSVRVQLTRVGRKKRAAGIEPSTESLEGSHAAVTPRPRESKPTWRYASQRFGFSSSIVVS